MTLSAIRPQDFPWFRFDGYTFSLGLTDGETAWLSGHSASRFDPEAKRMVVTGSMGEQTRTAYAKISAILAAAKLGPRDVVRVVENVTVTGLETHGEAAAVGREVLGDGPAVVSTMVVERLLRPGALVEIEVTAARGGKDDGTIHLPTLLPLDAHGAVVAPGDADAQYAVCLRRAEEQLVTLGLGLENVAKVGWQRSSAADGDPPALPGAPAPAVVSAVVSRLHRPGVVVALDVVASREPLERVDPGWGTEASPAVRAGRILHVSGLTARDPRTGRVDAPGDVVGQAHAIYERLREVLETAGAGPRQLVKTIEHVCDEGLASYRGVAGVRTKLLAEPWPASTGAVVGAVGAEGELLAVDATATLEP